MNELEFIRDQVRTERRHMAEVRSILQAALSSTPASPVTARSIELAARYLVFSVRRFDAQDQMHCEQLAPRISAGDAVACGSLAALAQTLSLSRAAIEQLQCALTAAGAAPDSETLRIACEGYLDFYRRSLTTLRASLYPLLEQHYGVADWRRASLVDAESIISERELYDAVRAAADATAIHD